MTRKMHNTESGFTLVELAIVMMIIGLLIGGILKGQELMMNARVTSTISQAKSFDAAVTTFRDTYNAWPGDMINAQARLPDCDGGATLDCYNGGTAGGTGGDGIVGPAGNVGVAPAANNEEQVQFWIHLLAADLISGVNASVGVALAWGEAMPSAPIGGGWFVGHHSGAGAIIGADPASTSRAGTYISIVGEPANDADAQGNGAMPLNAKRAAQIDRKLDDGRPNAGSVIGIDDGNALGVCDGTGAPVDTYIEGDVQGTCGVHIRIQS